jgi:hypothetical protein
MEKRFPEKIEDLPVKMYKLVNGENIIAYTHTIDDESGGSLIHIEEPMKVITEPDNHFVLTPWLPFAMGSLHVLESFNILLTTDLQDDIKAHYMKIVLDEIQHDKDLLIEQTKLMKGNATTH